MAFAPIFTDFGYLPPLRSYPQGGPGHFTWGSLAVTLSHPPAFLGMWFSASLQSSSVQALPGDALSTSLPHWVPCLRYFIRMHPDVLPKGQMGPLHSLLFTFILSEVLCIWKGGSETSLLQRGQLGGVNDSPIISRMVEAPKQEKRGRLGDSENRGGQRSLREGQ